MKKRRVSNDRERERERERRRERERERDGEGEKDSPHSQSGVVDDKQFHVLCQLS